MREIKERIAHYNILGQEKDVVEKYVLEKGVEVYDRDIAIENDFEAYKDFPDIIKRLKEK